MSRYVCYPPPAHFLRRGTIQRCMSRIQSRAAAAVSLAVLAGAGVLAAAQAPPQKPKAPPVLLPPVAGALHLQAPATAEASPAAAAADPAHAALLREDGLTDASTARYAGPAGEIAARAYRFGDATGAYAAFTALRDAGMHNEALGVDGAAVGNRFLFWTGATVIDASAGKADAATLHALRELAAALPKPHGSSAVPPPMRGYLPVAGLRAETVHYAIGPAGYAASGAPLPESVIDFSRDAEVATAKYSIHGQTGSLLLLAYPTPQMADNRRKAIAALLQSGGAAGLPVGSPGVVVESIGPLVALTAGPISAAEAHTLIQGIRYNTVLTINHPEGYVSEVSKAAKLLLGIAYMVIILAVAAVLLAVFLGGGRVLIRRMRGKPDSSLNDDDFISLKLG